MTVSMSVKEQIAVTEWKNIQTQKYEELLNSQKSDDKQPVVESAALTNAYLHGYKIGSFELMKNYTGHAWHILPEYEGGPDWIIFPLGTVRLKYCQVTLEHSVCGGVPVVGAEVPQGVEGLPDGDNPILVNQEVASYLADKPWLYDGQVYTPDTSSDCGKRGRTLNKLILYKSHSLK